MVNKEQGTRNKGVESLYSIFPVLQSMYIVHCDARGNGFVHIELLHIESWCKDKNIGQFNNPELLHENK